MDAKRDSAVFVNFNGKRGINMTPEAIYQFKKSSVSSLHAAWMFMNASVNQTDEDVVDL